MCYMSQLNTVGEQLWDFWAYVAEFGKLSKAQVPVFNIFWDCSPIFGHSLVTAFQLSYIKTYYF